MVVEFERLLDYLMMGSVPECQKGIFVVVGVVVQKGA